MPKKLFSREYFQDRQLLLLSSIALTAMVAIVVRVLVSVKPYDYKVAVGYTQYGADSLSLGEWYALYETAIFAFITTVIVLLLSTRVYTVDKYLSYGIVALQLIVLMFTLVVSNALIGASSIVS